MMKKNEILILGKGYVGQRLAKEWGSPLAAERISAYNDILPLIKKFQPKTIINCIGYTGETNVDDCEKNIDKTLMANTIVPILLGEAGLRHNIKIVHISSGCIFHYDYEKEKPIAETKPPDYFDLFYSRSKIYSDMALQELSRRYNILIPRIRIPLDDRPHPKNIINKLIKYKSVIDIPNSVTYIPDFIKALEHLIFVKTRGIFNVTLKDGLRYPELLDEYVKYHPEFQYKILPLNKLKIKRTNLILSTQKLEQTGFNVRNTKEVISECVKNYVNC